MIRKLQKSGKKTDKKQTEHKRDKKLPKSWWQEKNKTTQLCMPPMVVWWRLSSYISAFTLLLITTSLSNDLVLVHQIIIIIKKSNMVQLNVPNNVQKWRPEIFFTKFYNMQPVRLILLVCGKKTKKKINPISSWDIHLKWGNKQWYFDSVFSSSFPRWSVEQQSQSGNHQECVTEERRRHGGVAEVGVAALVSVVEVEAAGVFLPTDPTLRGNSTALFIHGHGQGSSSSCGHAEETPLTRRTLLRELKTVQGRNGRKQTCVASQRSCQRKTTEENNEEVTSRHHPCIKI